MITHFQIHNDRPAVAATTRSSQWRHDAGVLGSLPFAVCRCSPRWFESNPFGGS